MSDTPITPSVGAATLSGVTTKVGFGITPPGTSLNFAGNSPLMYPVRPVVNVNQNEGLTTCTWTGLINGTTGIPAGLFPAPFAYDQACAQLSGTFGAGGTFELEGSFDNVNWSALSPGNKTQAGIFMLGAGEQPSYIRPHVTGGDGTTLLNCILQFAKVH